MKLTWQQKQIGADLVAASEQLVAAKQFGSIGGPLASTVSAAMVATARRKVSELVDMAAMIPTTTKQR